jgi:hypothetical protein
MPQCLIFLQDSCTTPLEIPLSSSTSGSDEVSQVLTCGTSTTPPEKSGSGRAGSTWLLLEMARQAYSRFNGAPSGAPPISGVETSVPALPAYARSGLRIASPRTNLAAMTLNRILLLRFFGTPGEFFSASRSYALSITMRTVPAVCPLLMRK